jgi:hypothetical protein
MVDNLNVFMSYSRKDGSVHANELQKYLTNLNIRTWRDEKNLNPYSGLGYEIEQAIENCSHIVICVTQDTKRKNSYVRLEIDYALRLNPPKPLIVLRFEDIIPHIALVSFPSIDLFPDWDAGFYQLVQRLNFAISKPSLTSHPDIFRDYVEELAQYLNHQLKARVFNIFQVKELLPVRAIETPSAVADKNIPIAFHSRLPAWLGDGKNSSNVYDNFAEAFERHNKRVLLLGEPGSGKTTTLLDFAVHKTQERLQDANALMPVFAEVYGWRPSESVIEWLAKVTELSVGVYERR